MLTNKVFLLSGILLMCLNCANQRSNTEKLRKNIENIISRTEGTIAVAFEDLKTGDKLFINDKIQMHAASTMKTPVMIEVYKQASEAHFSLTDSVLIKNEFRSIVDGSKYTMDFGEDSDDVVYKNIGKRMSIHDLVYQMITVSSNFATNILIDLVKAENVMSTMKTIDANKVRVLRGVEDIKAYESGLNNTTDAYDMLLIMKAIAQKRVVSPNACEKMINILLQQKFKSKIPALLPSTVKVAHKTGSITEIDHDAAIVYLNPEHAYVLVILTKGIKSHKHAQKTIARISRMIYDVVFLG
ncbi:serine hydrolase [candidate division KSB1 bacterium]|nr:serine hydrolase [candidate division KSB1 bacterium]MBL7094441.1 serine hydrolase [candidate division KSB1 bacterium]